MDQETYNKLIAFIWGIASDCLVDTYDVGDYRKIILPMMVIRRFDAVLEPTKEAVIKMKKTLEASGVTNNIDEALCTVTKEAFCNSSPWNLRDLKSRTNQQQLKSDFITYLNGFSQNVQEIINKFRFRNEIDILSDHDILGLLITKFVDPRINLSSRPIQNDDGSIRLPALDNHAMGMMFEEVIRKFNEETNVTDAGRHFTPRDIVELMADLAFIPIQDKIKAKNNTYLIYDGACGTGGMLTVGEKRIKELASLAEKKVSIHLFGQENADETYAIACSDMLVKGEGAQASNIFYGSTISNDGFAGKTFDFMLSNPPFGTPWKTDLKAWGDIKKEDITDSRFVVSYDAQTDYSLIPDIGDPQMLFLANNISKMKTDTKLGSRIVEVHNGSSLFTGKAGQGPSNLRRYIIEQDLLEAIVALPENMFYNTGIGTFLWILCNKKPKNRKGKIQLIDATSMKYTLRKNIGDKNCEVTPELRKQILELYGQFEKADYAYSKVFDNNEFGYWSVDILRPLRLAVELTDERLDLFLTETADTALYTVLRNVQKQLGYDVLLNYNDFIAHTEVVATDLQVKMQAKRLKAIRTYFTYTNEKAHKVCFKKHLKDRPDPFYGIFPKEDGCYAYPTEYEADKALKDTEIVPFTYEGGIEEFFRNEVLPYAPDAWMDKKSITIGYELSFTKHFYKPVKLREIKDIIADIANIEGETDGLLASIIGGAF